MIILLWSWTIGITITWVSAKTTMQQRGRKDVAGEYKAVFELADAMHEQLASVVNEEANDARQMNESTIRQHITKDLRGGTIAYDTSLLSERVDGTEGNEWTMKAWARKEMWWVIALTASVVVDVIIIRAFVMEGMRGDLFVFWMLPLALMFAMYVGTTHHSRAMVLFWVALVFCIIPAIILGVIFQMLTQ
jgi:hypothetical protein